MMQLWKMQKQMLNQEKSGLKWLLLNKLFWIVFNLILKTSFMRNWDNISSLTKVDTLDAIEDENRAG